MDKVPVSTAQNTGHPSKDLVRPSTLSSAKSASTSKASAASALQNYNTEVLGILKELSANQNTFSDKLVKLSSSVDNLYEQQQDDNDFGV